MEAYQSARLRKLRKRIKFSSNTDTLKWISFIMIILTLGVITKARQYLYSDSNVAVPDHHLKVLIDLQNFVLQSNNEICRKSDKDKKLLQISVHSSRKNYNRRNAIRESWGSIKFHKDWQISVAFLLGSTPKTSNGTVEKVISSVIEHEQHTHGDLVIGNFEDTYKNLTYKHMMGYKWVVDFCPQVDIYVKTDDDVFINIYKIIEWLDSRQVKDNIYCYVLRGYSPWRSKRYKFYISKDEYKPNKFPDYCSGVGYITTPQVLRQLLAISVQVEYLWVEDLFVTGLLTKYYNALQRVNQSHKPRKYNSFSSSPDNSMYYPAVIKLEDQSHNYLNEQYETYKKWLEDPSQNQNPWMFILLEKSNDQDLVIDQKSLFQKTFDLKNPL